MKVGIIGCGYWGRKLLERCVERLGRFNVTACDPLMPHTRAGATCPDYKKLLTWPVKASRGYQSSGVDACIVATPISTHYAIVKACLEAGKHVLVEKPMAKTGEEARELVIMAAALDKVLRTDLTFLEHQAVKSLAGPEVAALFWAGPQSPRSDEGLLWTWGPHPVSIMLHAQRGVKPVRLEADVDDGYLDLAYHFEDDSRTVVNMRWGPEQDAYRQVTLRNPQTHQYSILDLTPIPEPEPLAQVMEHFLQAVKKHDTTPDWIGLKTVEVLEWTEQQLKSRS